MDILKVQNRINSLKQEIETHIKKRELAEIADKMQRISNYYCNSFGNYKAAEIYLNGCLLYAKQLTKSELEQKKICIKRETKTKQMYASIMKVKQLQLQC